MPPGSWLQPPSCFQAKAALTTTPPTPVVLMKFPWISSTHGCSGSNGCAPEGPDSPATLLPWFIFFPRRCFSWFPLSTPPTSIPAFSASQLFLASHFTFLLGRELCGVLTFPQWHLKCFLVQNILFIAIETGSSVCGRKGRKEAPGSLKLCNSVICPNP